MTGLDELAAERRRLAAELDSVWEQLRVATLAAVASGMPETTAAVAAGVDRMTVRKWRGKRQRKAG